MNLYNLTTQFSYLEGNTSKNKNKVFTTFLHIFHGSRETPPWKTPTRSPFLLSIIRNIVSPLSLKYGISVHAKTTISQYHAAKWLFPPSGIFPQNRFHFVEMQSTFFFHIFKKDWNLLKALIQVSLATF